MERCRGFSSHLFKLLLRQRRRLAKITERFTDLRYVCHRTCYRESFSFRSFFLFSLCISYFFSFKPDRRLINTIQDVRSQMTSGEQESILPPQDSLSGWVAKARTLAQQCCVALQQISWVLHCCPEGSPATLCQSGEGGQGEATLSHPTPLSAHLQPQACLMRRGETSWVEAVKSIEALQSESTQLKDRLNALGHESTQKVVQTRLDS